MRDSLVYQGRRFAVRRLELPGERTPRELVVHPGAAVILPLLSPSQLVLIKNERFAVQESLWELPAGTLEPGEAPAETAVRELLEETGYRASQMWPLLEFYTSPGFCNEKLFAFVASGLEFVGQHLDVGEKISVHRVTFVEMDQMIRNGTLRDGKSLATYLAYRLTSDNNSFS